jgi:hypothetical protein
MIPKIDTRIFGNPSPYGLKESIGDSNSLPLKREPFDSEIFDSRKFCGLRFA